MTPLASSELPAKDPGRWSASLVGSAGERLATMLDRLELDALALYPPPRTGRFPFGREITVLARRLGKRSVQLHPSGFARVYGRFASDEHRRLFRAFTLGHALDRNAWTSMLGADEMSSWLDAGLLYEDRGGIRSAFRVVTFEGLRLVVDAFAHETRFRNRVHVGLDTVTLFEFASRGSGFAGRHLDVGTGSGALLLAGCARGDNAVGVDLNPRAVDVARFNARFNRRECTVLHGDIFGMDSLGLFDTVTWNLPFHFLPEAERADNLDGDGGQMGIELTTRFVERLPELLSPTGRAYLLTSSPTLDDGKELLFERLESRAPSFGLDVRAQMIQALWSPSRRNFYRSNGIRRVENVALELCRGKGRIQRLAAPATQRAVDWIQGIRHGVRST